MDFVNSDGVLLPIELCGRCVLYSEHVDRAGEGISLHSLAHQRRQPLGTLRKLTGFVATITRTAPVGPIISTPSARR